MEHLTDIFSKELRRLADEYHRCPSRTIQKHIQKDIELLETALYLCKNKKGN